MSLSDALRAALRFAAGTLGSVLAGLVVFRGGVFHPSRPAFQCVTLGALAALLLALVRGRRYGAAVTAAAAFAAWALSIRLDRGLVRALSMGTGTLAVAGGILVMGVVYDALAETGFRFGKFLVTGPLVAGVYVAATPLMSVSARTSGDVVTAMWINALIGISVGDGVGAGTELAELALARRAARPAAERRG